MVEATKGAAPAAPGLPVTLEACEEAIDSIHQRRTEDYMYEGALLKHIRDHEGGLYKPKNGGKWTRFEDYCQQRWGYGRRRANQIIEAAEVGRILPNPPANAGVATELIPLQDEPVKLRQVWAKATEPHNGKPTKPTAQRVRHLVHEVKPPKPKKQKNLAKDPAVVEWMKDKLDWTREQACGASENGTDGWPRPGEAMNHDDWRLIKRLAEDGVVVKPKPKSRTQEAKEAKQRALSFQEQLVALGSRARAATELQKITNQAMTLQIALYRFDLAELDTLGDALVTRLMDDTFEDLAALYEVLHRRVGEFQARTEDDKVREVIEKLRAKADSTPFPGEAKSFNDAADEFERRLNNRLAA